MAAESPYKVKKYSQQPSNGFRLGRWTKEEHFRFMEALKLYGKEWKRVQEHVRTRTSTQARSHAQKFFNKLEKRGQTLEFFLESIDLNNLEDHCIMSDLEEEAPHTTDLGLMKVKSVAPQKASTPMPR